MTMKKKILTTLSVVLILGLAALGILAYLSDTDSDVNVMTLGNVEIKQHEYERVVDANGEYTTIDVDGTQSYELKDFTQGKPLYPMVGDPNDGYDITEVRLGQLGHNSRGGMSVLPDANVQDKFVVVENTGKSPAYVRTIVAFEAGSVVEEDWYKLVNYNAHFTWKETQDWFVTEIDGNNYYIVEFVYNGYQDIQHPNGVLKPGDYTYNSLAQVYLYSHATNEDVAALDGNKNGQFDILVLSQAIQTEGFDNAKTALDIGFGKFNEENVKAWFGGLVKRVGTPEDLKNAFAEGGYVELTDDIELEKITPVEPGAEVYLNLNGKTITVDQETKSNTLIWVKDGAKLVVDGNGTIDLEGVSTMAIFCPYGELVIENGTFKRNEVTNVTNATTGLFMGAKNSGCNVTINGGYFDPGYYDENAADIEGILAGTKTFTETEADKANRDKPGDANLVRVAIKDNVSVVLNHSGYGSFKVYGGTFVGANPAWGDEGCMLPTTPNYLRPWSYYQGALLDGQTYHADGLVIPEGYSITKSINADGIPVYTVNYSK